MTAYLLIGGNMGDRFGNLAHAISLVSKRCGEIIATSAIYETAAWGYADQPAFLNQVIVLETILPPADLMKNLLGIEQEIGRVREQKMGPRIIDIDILLFDDQIINEQDIQIPHPSLHLRRFALIPLAEVAAEKEHPIFKRNIAELLTDCPDTLEVTKIS